MDLVKKQKQLIMEYTGAAVRSCIADGVLPIGEEDIPEIVIEVPREKMHGDFATNLALVMAGRCKMPPRKVAEQIAARMSCPDPASHIQRVEVAGPGFINFILDPTWVCEVVEIIAAEGPDYGKTSAHAGEMVQVEFVSANPTGPMNVVNARAAAIGDTLANLLAAVGYDARREFYVNDAGNQADLFGRSVAARYAELLGESAEFPENGYPGEYVRGIAREFMKEHPELASMGPDERIEFFKERALDRMVEWQKSDLKKFGVEFDVWFRERDLHREGQVMATIRELESRGHTYEKDGAIWFASSALGDDKDRVLVRSDGTPTYFAADLAYHRNKFARGFNKVIDILGPDHHGYVSRTMAGVKALGQPDGALEIIILQLVTLMRGGEVVRMSKRTGSFITMDELVEEVGKDAARFFFIMRSPDSHLEFDMELAKQQTADNPVYYVQYAHARVCSIFAQAEQQGISIPSIRSSFDGSLLGSQYEVDLMKKLAEYPAEVEAAADKREPHRIARYAHELASLFHSFYTHCRVLGEDENLQNSRLLLVDAVRTVLANALALMGIEAPERM